MKRSLLVKTNMIIITIDVILWIIKYFIMVSIFVKKNKLIKKKKEKLVEFYSNPKLDSS